MEYLFAYIDIVRSTEQNYVLCMTFENVILIGNEANWGRSEKSNRGTLYIHSS
jgi:hypothetical protein